VRCGKSPVEEPFFLLNILECELYKEDEYDDSTWTREELQSPAWEAGERMDWDEQDDDSVRS